MAKKPIEEDQMVPERRSVLGILPVAAAAIAGASLLPQKLAPLGIGTAFAAATGDADVITRFDPRTQLGEPVPMGPGWQVEGHPMPTGAGKPFFASTDGAFNIGVFEAGPALVRLAPYQHDEFWLLLEGVVDFTNQAGQTVVFKKGDTFVVPRGFSGTSRIHETMRKLAITYAPRA